MPLDPTKLKRRREQLGMTQAQIAMLVGLQRSNYSRIEVSSGAGDPGNVKLALAERIAKALHISLVSLLK